MTDVAGYEAEMRACANAIGLDPPAIVIPEDRWVTLHGIRFHYLDWGNDEKPPLVLLHGGSLTAHTWDMAALLLRDPHEIENPFDHLAPDILVLPKPVPFAELKGYINALQRARARPRK